MVPPLFAQEASDLLREYIAVTRWTIGGMAAGFVGVASFFVMFFMKMWQRQADNEKALSDYIASDGRKTLETLSESMGALHLNSEELRIIRQVRIETVDKFTEAIGTFDKATLAFDSGLNKLGMAVERCKKNFEDQDPAKIAKDVEAVMKRKEE